MKVWVRVDAHTISLGHKGLAVIDDIEVFDHPVEQSFEREVQELKPCICPHTDTPFPDSRGNCSTCGGTLFKRFIRGQAYEPHAGHAALSEDGQPLHWTYWMTQRSEERCHSMLNGQRCQKFHGHLGLHQECNETWSSS